MTGEDILKLAGELFARSRTPSESLCRTIAGRSYYAAFHLTLEYLGALGQPKTNDHKTPVRLLMVANEVSAKKAARLLDDLYAARRRADYDLIGLKAIAESRDLKFIKAQVEMATEVKSLLDSCAAEPARTTIKTAIEAFRRSQTRPTETG